jgi:hypothetical protein
MREYRSLMVLVNKFSNFLCCHYLFVILFIIVTVSEYVLQYCGIVFILLKNFKCGAGQSEELLALSIFLLKMLKLLMNLLSLFS